MTEHNPSGEFPAVSEGDIARITPLAKPESDEPQDPRLVWFGLLDNRYHVEVQRVGEPATMSHVFTGTRPEFAYNAFLHIFDRQNGDEVLLSEEVGLSYASLFGPDIEDVANWEEIAINFIDSVLPEQRVLREEQPGS